MMASSRLRKVLVGTFTWKRAAFSCVEIYVGVWLVVQLLVNQLMFHPPESRAGAGVGTFTVPTRAGDHVALRWIETPGATVAVLASHGNGEDLGSVNGYLHEVAKLGVSVLGYDYPGYGASDGTPSESGVYAAVDAAYDWLTTTRGIPPNRIVVLGQSIGSGPSTYLAARKPVGALVLDSPFLSIFRVATSARIFPFDRFVNSDHIAGVKCPLLLIHARRDQVVPFSHGERLFALAHQPKRALWLDTGGHTDGIWTSDAYARELRATFTSVATP